MGTRGIIRIAAAGITAAASFTAIPAGAASAARVCVRAPCGSQSRQQVATTTAHHIRAYRAEGWTCSHAVARRWLCVRLVHL